MRLGGPIKAGWDSPEGWVATVREHGYGAAYCPLTENDNAEVRPGLGGLDYRVFLRELATLDPDLPLMLEHLPSLEEYAIAGAHIRAVAAEEGLTSR